MEITEDDLKIFVNDIYSPEFNVNKGGMGIPDLFSFWFILTRLAF